jgi:hypothetical protein
MNITWVLADNTQLDPTTDIKALKNLGSIWGGWRTWRAYATDNVVCHDIGKAQELVQRNFQTLCNLYVPNSAYVMLGRPTGVKLYEGELEMELDNKDELVAMNLAATVSDVVLLVGFDWPEQDKNPDKLLEHRAHNYRGVVNHLIQQRSGVQWVLVDPPQTVRPDLSKFDNFSTDSLKSVLKLLNN